MLANEVAKTLIRLGYNVAKIVYSGEDAVQEAREQPEGATPPGSPPLALAAADSIPGYEITREIHRHGMLDDDWSKMDCVNFVFVPKEIGAREVLEKHYGEFLARFYRRPFMKKVYRTMLLQSPHSYWRLIRNAPSFLSYASGMKKEKNERTKASA